MRFPLARILCLALLPLLGCEAIDRLSNPLIGRWTAETATPIGGFSLGTYEFAPERMSAFGLDVPVDYAVSGDAIRIMPRDFGPQFDVTMIDRNTARIAPSLIGDRVTLHRLR